MAFVRAFLSAPNLFHGSMYKLKCEAFSTFSRGTSTRTGEPYHGCESGSAPPSTGMEKSPRDTRYLQPCVIREEHKWSVDYEGSGAGGRLGERLCQLPHREGWEPEKNVVCG